MLNSYHGKINGRGPVALPTSFSGSKTPGAPQYVGESPPPPDQEEEEGSVGLRNQKREEGCNWALSPEWDFSGFSGGYFVLVVGQSPYKWQPKAGQKRPSELAKCKSANFE